MLIRQLTGTADYPAVPVLVFDEKFYTAPKPPLCKGCARRRVQSTTAEGGSWRGAEVAARRADGGIVR